MTTKDIPDVGKSAPAFTLLSDKGEKVKLSDFKGEKNVVLYFYPKDNTPGCTKEAIAFKDDINKFKRQDAVILGVSPDDLKSHEKFRDKYELPFDLLVDTDHKICENIIYHKNLKLYSVWYAFRESFLGSG